MLYMLKSLSNFTRGAENDGHENAGHEKAHARRQPLRDATQRLSMTLAIFQGH